MRQQSDGYMSPSGNDLVSGLTDELTYRDRRQHGPRCLGQRGERGDSAHRTGSPSSGYVLKTFRLNGGNGLVGKGFLRASVVK